MYNNNFLTREPTDSLLSGNVQYSDEINNLLMIEVDLTKTKTPLDKDGSVFLLNDVESTLHDKPIKIYGQT